MSRAQPIEESENPRLYQIVRELTTRADLPMPRLYMIPQDQPNAFATGRNPKHSAVAVTRGITKLLSEDELRGVLAHELAHIRNRDILIQSVASAIGAAITYLAYMLMWFGSDDESPLGLVASLAMVLLAPIAASIIQLAISRQREYAADAGGAEICGNPESLASALLRLEQGAEAMPMQVNQAAEPLYIVKPFSGKGIAGLFSTHPPIEERVKRLRQMRPSLLGRRADALRAQALRLRADLLLGRRRVVAEDAPGVQRQADAPGDDQDDRPEAAAVDDRPDHDQEGVDREVGGDVDREVLLLLDLGRGQRLEGPSRVRGVLHRPFVPPRRCLAILFEVKLIGIQVFRRTDGTLARRSSSRSRRSSPSRLPRRSPAATSS